MDMQFEMKSARVSEGSASPDSDTVLEQQTRTRRLFSSAQLFAFSLVYMGTWYSVGSNMYYALFNGGPAGWFFSYITVMCGALCQAASFGEMASIQPVAGAQYYWTYHFAPENAKLLLTWLQGWTTWTGYVSLLASCLNGNTVVFEAMIQLNHPDYETGGWRITLIILATLAFCAFVNIYAFRLVPWFELLTGILNVFLFFIFVIVLYIMSPRNSSDIFLLSSISSGWDNYFVAANLGSLSNLFLFIGFESVIHMGEETRNAKIAVPRALFWSVFTNCALAFVMVITFAICMPSVEEMLNSPSPLVTILLHSTGSAKVTTAMISGLTVMGISGSMGVVSSVSRLTWAWARDGGLPRYFGYVDAKQRVPVRAVVLTCAIVTCLALLNLGTGSYIALGAIMSLSSLGMYLSYAIVLVCIIYARLTNSIQLGEWNWGRAGIVLNVVALVYTVWVMIWLPFPSALPVSASNMNYCGPVFGAVMIGVFTYWYVWARKHWSGPSRAIVDIVLQQASKN